MKHVMNLHSVPFEMIRSGRKTIELRLYDEKRRLISIGDEIKFVSSYDSTMFLNCRVIALHKFDSLKICMRPYLFCGVDILKMIFRQPRLVIWMFIIQEKSKRNTV